MEHLKYPIGRFDNEVEHSLEEVPQALAYLSAFPAILREKVKDLSAEDLEKTYREGGWNIRQLVHHLADSHLNLYVRIKLSLTEENPSIKGYAEDLWAEQSDYFLPIESSLQFLEVIHLKIVNLFENMSAEDFEKTYYHPGYQKTYILKNVIHLYEWHSKHHLEHIRIAVNNEQGKSTFQNSSLFTQNYSLGT
jgi:hypothetical protein